MAVLLVVAPQAQEGVRYPPKPGPRDFILDEAKILKPDDATEIRILCDEALTKKKAPIVVVTIPSLAAYGAQGWPIERYALNLMSEWGVGWSEWNYGMLLLVSMGDRKARIELGGSWERRKDDEAKRIMSERVIPYFKKGDPSKGILEGVRGLHDLALDKVPTRSQPNRTSPVPAPAPGIPSPGGGCLPGGGCGLIVLIVGGIVVVMVISRLMRRGTVSSWGNRGPYGYGGGYGGGGFGSGFGGGLLGGALGSMLGHSIGRHFDTPSSAPPPSYGSDSSSSSSSDSSDFGGGSFGGGFSGGGGATGEW
ncbi:MAG TPA: TPM domain-containing protein [Planctomycetota bacterium]|jgi:uncharacterized protein|nr:TPM domain-containing protein [Planctomycetota bacterium]